MAGTLLTSSSERLWGGLGLGGQYDWADGKYSLYGEASANTSLAEFSDSYVLTGRAGFRLTW